MPYTELDGLNQRVYKHYAEKQFAIQSVRGNSGAIGPVVEAIGSPGRRLLLSKIKNIKAVTSNYYTNWWDKKVQFQYMNFGKPLNNKKI